MPVVGLLAPLIVAAWTGATGEDGLAGALLAFFWPGVLFYAGAIAVLWAGWKIDLE
jgi:hypothetical protein